MAELRLSRRASDEIYDEAERLGAYSPAYARTFIDSVFAKADLLRQFPQLGRMVPEYNDPTIRELFYSHYAFSTPRLLTALLQASFLYNQAVFRCNP